MNIDKTKALAFIDPIRLNIAPNLAGHIKATNTVIDYFITDENTRKIVKLNLKTSILIDALCNIIYETFDYASYETLTLVHEIQLLPIKYTKECPELQLLLSDALLHYAQMGDSENSLENWIAICYAQIVDNIDCHIYNM